MNDIGRLFSFFDCNHSRNVASVRAQEHARINLCYNTNMNTNMQQSTRMREGKEKGKWGLKDMQRRRGRRYSYKKQHNKKCKLQLSESPWTFIVRFTRAILLTAARVLPFSPAPIRKIAILAIRILRILAIRRMIGGASNRGCNRGRIGRRRRRRCAVFEWQRPGNANFGITSTHTPSKGVCRCF